MTDKTDTNAQPKTPDESVSKKDASISSVEKGASEKPDTPSDFLNMGLPHVSEQSVYQSGEADASASEGLDNAGESVPSPDEAERLKSEQAAARAREAEQYRGLRDDNGREFDPSIHVVPPEKTPTGRWKRKGKKQQQKQAENGEQETTSNIDYRKEAQKAAILYASLHAIPFPTDSKPNPQQFSMLTDAIEQYYMAEGIQEIPPSINLLLSAGMYSQEIVTRPTNLEKCKKFFSKWVDKFRYAKDRQNKRKNGERIEALHKAAEKKPENEPAKAVHNSVYGPRPERQPYHGTPQNEAQ